MHKQLQQLDVNAVAAANSVAFLKEVDKVKGRMEAACSTLKVYWLFNKLRTALQDSRYLAQLELFIMFALVVALHAVLQANDTDVNWYSMASHWLGHNLTASMF